jgi:biotin operon repressor
MKNRDESNLTRLLKLLDDKAWHSGEELAAKVGWRFGATIHEARGKGYRIEKRRTGHNQYEYQLLL